MLILRKVVGYDRLYIVLLIIWVKLIRRKNGVINVWVFQWKIFF